VTTTANYTVSRCEGLINQGQAPLNVATGTRGRSRCSIHRPESEQKALLEVDKGRCDAWRKHIFNFTASIESPQFGNKAVRMLGSGWRLSGVFRAQSGAPLTVVSGVDRALSGIQGTTQRASQVLDDPYGNKDALQWLNPTAFAQPALGTYGNSVRNAYDGPRLPHRRPVARAVVPLPADAPCRGTHRGVQRVELVSSWGIRTRR
jgi:hypothetical protein